MSSIVFELAGEHLPAMTQKLAPHAVTNKNPHALTMAKIQSCTVTLYKSGKLLIQGAGATSVADFLGLEQIAEQTTDSSRKHQTSLGNNLPNNQQVLIGTDEVGNGSYFGGLAVVASLVTPNDHAWLKSLGVDDSKTLTDHKILHIAPLLEERIPHKALLLSPQKYNQVVGEGLMHNAVSVKVALHNQAIFLLLQEVDSPDAIVIDAFTSQRNYAKYLKTEKNQFTNPISLVEKAESQYLAVAVSSIIARSLFLNNLKELGEELGYQLPSGAGSKSDKVASQILASYGMAGLGHVAKLHFKNTQKAQALLK